MANCNRIANSTSSLEPYKRVKTDEVDVTQYENRIQELKKILEENQHDKQRLIDEVI